MENIRYYLPGVGSIKISIEKGRAIVAPPKKLESKFKKKYPNGCYLNVYSIIDKKRMKKSIDKIFEPWLKRKK